LAIDREPSEGEETLLVERLCAGDERAFERFADCYLPSLLRYARSRLPGDSELARDVAQSTVSRVIENLASFRGESSLSTWMFACCRNEIAAHFRRAGRRPREVELAPGEEWPATDPSPEGTLLSAERVDLVHAALDRMSPVQARAMEWRYVEGLGVDEIARRLESSYKAAESLLSRGRVAFRTIYARLAGFEPRGGEMRLPQKGVPSAVAGAGSSEVLS
jgi:RNA polymerase sigma-70 factor (ECF subfamily)